MSLAYHQPPRDEWPTASELADQPPAGPPLPPEERAALVAELAALQESVAATACSYPDCARQRHARGWCKLHYRRWRNHGDPSVVLVPQASRAYERTDERGRFWDKVDKGGDAPVFAPALGRCWIWTGALSDTGYGSFVVNPPVRGGEARRVNAHRWAYEDSVGPIPYGLQLDHLCRVRSCVNPQHLDPVSNSENGHRGAVARAQFDCEGCGTRCEICGERMCSMYGPEPAATCGAHIECVDCHTDNRCRECRRVADEAVET